MIGNRDPNSAFGSGESQESSSNNNVRTRFPLVFVAASIILLILLATVLVVTSECRSSCSPLGQVVGIVAVASIVLITAKLALGRKESDEPYEKL